MLGKKSISINDWTEDGRPCERVINYVSNRMSSDVNLLRILIGSGDRRTRENLVDLIREILNKLFTVENIDQASITEIFHIQGISAAKVRRIKIGLGS